LVYGHSTGLSLFSVVVAAIFWSWLWGPIGLILSTPLTLRIVVIGRHVKRLEFRDVMRQPLRLLLRMRRPEGARNREHRSRDLPMPTRLPPFSGIAGMRRRPPGEFVFRQARPRSAAHHHRHGDGWSTNENHDNRAWMC